METIAVIPLRAGSKGIPSKNIVELHGAPLFMHSVQCAELAGISRVILATDIAELFEAPLIGAELFRRSSHSARDEAGTHEVLIELIEAKKLHAKTIVLLQATSPFRSSRTVQSAISKFNQGKHDLVCSIVSVDSASLKAGMLCGDTLKPLVDAQTLFTPRQALPTLYKLDGGVYVFKGQWLVDNGSLVTERIGTVISAPEEVLDIDTPKDLELARARLPMNEFE